MPEVIARRAFLKIGGVSSGLVVLASRPSWAGPTKKLSGRSTTVTASVTQPPPSAGWWPVWPEVW